MIVGLNKFDMLAFFPKLFERLSFVIFLNLCLLFEHLVFYTGNTALTAHLVLLSLFLHYFVSKFIFSFGSVHHLSQQSFLDEDCLSMLLQWINFNQTLARRNGFSYFTFFSFPQWLFQFLISFYLCLKTPIIEKFALRNWFCSLKRVVVIHCIIWSCLLHFCRAFFFSLSKHVCVLLFESFLPTRFESRIIIFFNTQDVCSFTFFFPSMLSLYVTIK